VTRAPDAVRPARVTGTGELARCLQPETDHLRGELFIDRLDPPARGAVMRKIADLA
jgi:peptide deformylase